LVLSNEILNAAALEAIFNSWQVNDGQIVRNADKALYTLQVDSYFKDCVTFNGILIFPIGLNKLNDFFFGVRVTCVSCLELIVI
jgi:hypothetical protein